MFLAGVLEAREVNRWLNQARVFARPGEEVAFLASSENFSAARRSRSRWAWACSEVTRG